MASARRVNGVFWNLGGCTSGMSDVAVRSLYLMCVRAIIEYGCEVWHHKLQKGQARKLEVIQNSALRRIIGAFKTTPLFELQKESAIPPLTLRLVASTRKKAVRIFQTIDKNNPVRNHLQTPFDGTVIAELRGMFLRVSKLEYIQPPIEDPPPWDMNRADDLETTRAKMEKYEILEESWMNINNTLLREWRFSYTMQSSGVQYRRITENLNAILESRSWFPEIL